MPLLSNAKHCYVGSQPITKIMAGDLQVWPKGISADDQVVIGKYVYAVWPYEFVDCPSLYADNYFRIGFDSRGDGVPDVWESWYAPEANGHFWFYLQKQKRMVMGHPISSLDDYLVDMLYYQVQDRRTGQTILTVKCDRNADVYPMPSEKINCQSPVPIPSQISTQLPGEATPRTFAAWNDTQNTTTCNLIDAWQVAVGYSDAEDGSTEPPGWDNWERLYYEQYKSIWPTYNAIVWSPDDFRLSYLENPEKLWYRVKLAGTNQLVVPPTQYKINAPFYPYPSGDGILC